jgi:hypothetical protein
MTYQQYSPLQEAHLTTAFFLFMAVLPQEHRDSRKDYEKVLPRSEKSLEPGSGDVEYMCLASMLPSFYVKENQH